MSSASSSSTTSSHHLTKEIKIGVTTRENVHQCGEGMEYTLPTDTMAYLENPSGLSKQAVIVRLYEDLYSIGIMHSLTHVNILKCYTYKKFILGNDIYYSACLENVSTPFSDFLENKKYFQRLLYKNYIPSTILTKLMRSIVDVLLFVHEKGMYHGALSWKTLLYEFDEHGNIVVKLANFLERKDLCLSEAQGEDWVAVASMLSEIKRMSDSLENKPTSVGFDKTSVGFDNHVITSVAVYTDHLTRAITFFQELTVDKRRDIPTSIGNMDFFFRPKDRKKYAARIYHWCENDSYRTILAKSDIVCKPWNVFGDLGVGMKLLATMNNARDRDGTREENNDYNGNNIIDFLKFVSGLYAHCDAIRKEIGHGLLEIDRFVCTEFPDLFYQLRRIQSEKNFIP